MSGLRIGSTCSGYEGLGMAIQGVFGGELAWVADNDPGAAKILAHHYPDVPNLGDITITDWSAVEPVDILAGGYPCQSFSDAGLRKGTADERHIWPHIATAIRVLRPRLVVLENVRGHLGRGFDVVLGDLARLGFDAEWCLASAAGVGACHRRQRVFILAWPAEDPDSAARGERRVAAAGEADSGRAWADAGRPDRARPAADPIGTGLEVRGVEHHGPQRQAAERGSAELATADANRGRFPELAERNGRPIARIGGPFGNDTERRGPAPGWAGDEFWATPGAFGRYDAAIRQHESAFGRRAPAPLGPGRNGDPRLAPEFAEWMMGLPAGWVTGVSGLSRNDQLHAIGNGVVVQQCVSALRHLLERAPEALRPLLGRGTAVAA